MISKFEKRNILISFVLCLITGVTIYVLDNYFQVQAEWGIESSPYLSLAKAFHYITTPLLILAVGFIIKSHIALKIKNLDKMFTKKKKSGLFLCIGLVLLIFSGQSLLIITSETIRELVIYFHLGIGLLMGLALIRHLRR
ncbi:MAG: hypothetical protein KC493_01710 [Bacteriovoracaceae bacterium]|nr:hypothetical protein [Bacteriovoracaceae bacterium]